MNPRKKRSDELKTKRFSTQRDMKNAMRQILLPRFGNRRMDSIKTGEVQSYLMSLIGSRKDGKVSRRTVLKLKTYLSSVFSAAIRLECGVTRNPVRAVRLPVEEFTDSTWVLDDLQAEQIAESLKDPRHKMMWNMNLWMGNRIGETRALRWKCIDWETGRVTVSESLFEGKSNKPKTKAGERAVVLIEAQLAELQKYKQKHFPEAEPSDWIFPGKRNRPIDTGWVMKKRDQADCHQAGMPGDSLARAEALERLSDAQFRYRPGGAHEARWSRERQDQPDLQPRGRQLAESCVRRHLAEAQLAKQELQRKQKKTEPQAPLSLLSVTLTVTPNRGAAAKSLKRW